MKSWTPILIPLWFASFPVFAQIAGQNVNMVSGTTWPNGDPFLQRQNEPSVAVSSRNPLHLLAGANDYRTVDLPGLPVGETGDAWLGIFKSYDGGQTWISTVHPGCRQNVAQCGGAPALKGFTAAADPVVRPGSNGMFYYSGIVFTRATQSSSLVFVSRFVDNNNEDNGDPIKYIDSTPVATAAKGTFVDKPWLAVDVPRAGAGSCTIQAPQASGGPISQTFPAGNLYVAYTVFVDEDEPPSQIMFARSRDCGATWSNPIALSDSTVNQGANIAIDPVSGAVYVAWRRFQNGNLSDAILLVKSTDGGQTFSAPVQVAAINTFDQATSYYSFRTNDYPTMAVDASGRVYVAWSERNAGQTGSNGDARIVLSTSHDGRNWTNRVAVDDFAARGHQFMPAITFGGGKLMLVYFDLRDDTTIGNFTAVGGGQYTETRVPAGDLATTPPHPEKVFTPFVLDAAPANLMEGGLLRRHTIDVRAALADPADTPAFTSTRASQYEFGSRQDSDTIEQLQVDPPNFPLFSQGTEAFFGDYLDVAAAPTIVPGATPGTWAFNTDSSSAVDFHAVWTDNRDVRPPADGNWANYTPPTSAAITGTSIFDPTQPQPACIAGQTGMRNQNIYTVDLTQGLVVASPSNAKTLGVLQRAFPVVVQNTTNSTRSYRLTIASQPPGGKASFLENHVEGLADPLTVLDISVGPISSASRMVFVTSAVPEALVAVRVAEISAPGAADLLPGGQTASLVLNPDPSNPADPATTASDIYNPAIANPAIANPAIANPAIANPAIANPAIANPAIANPDIANLAASNADISNPAIANPAIANPAIANPAIANAAITDASWPFSNTGNTAATYSFHFIFDKPIPPYVKAQLIITRVYNTPVAVGCNLAEQSQGVVLANTSAPEIVQQQTLSQTAVGQMLAAILRGARWSAGSPRPKDTSTTTIIDVTDTSADNTTITIGPNETVYVTLRFYILDNTQPLGFDPGQDVTTIGISQSTDTGGTLPPFAASKLFAASGTLPLATTGIAYDATLQASGGTSPYTFTLLSGTLPPGLTLNPNGDITGTVTGGSGTYSFTTSVTDSSATPSTVTESLTIDVTSVELAVTGLAAAGPNGATVKAGDTITVTATIANSGTAATGVAPVISVIPTGTASANCGAATPAASDIANGGSQVYTVQCTNASGAGTLQFQVQVGATDSTTGVYLNVSPATSNAITVLGAPPTTSATATAGGAAYTAGSWTNQPVVVTFTCTPAVGQASTQNVTVTSGGANQTVQTSCTDPAGNSTPASFGPININTGQPTVVQSFITPVVGLWYNSPVNVQWQCTDAVDGTNYTISKTISTQGAGQTVTATCTNLAGTSVTASQTVNVDLTPPTTTATPSTPPVIPGWWAGPVTVTFQCTDGLSGTYYTPAAQTFTGEVKGAVASGTCTDAAGNSSTANYPVNIDLTPPSIQFLGITPAPNGAGWYNSAVNVQWSCSDSGSGPTSATVARTLTSDGRNQSATGSCTDLVGHTASSTYSGINIDATAPTARLVSPANGFCYPLGAVIAASYSCVDGLSGIAGCAGTLPNRTSMTLGTPGTFSFTVTATDVAGNQTLVTNTYSVNAGCN